MYSVFYETAGSTLRPFSYLCIWYLSDNTTFKQYEQNIVLTKSILVLKRTAGGNFANIDVDVDLLQWDAVIFAFLAG